MDENTRLLRLRKLASEAPSAYKNDSTFTQWQAKVFGLLKFNIIHQARFRDHAEQVLSKHDFSVDPPDPKTRELRLKLDAILSQSIAELEADLPDEKGFESLAMETSGNTNLDVFISHSSKDADVAEILIELIRAALDIPHERIRCTSVDGYRLPGGVSTDEQIKAEVRQSTCFIALLTPFSLASSYVLFELGARWGAKLPLFTVLARGSQAKDLGAPLSSLNALSCYTASQLHQVLGDLGNTLTKNTNSPATYEKYIQQLVVVAGKPAQSEVSEDPESTAAETHSGWSEPTNPAAKELYDLIHKEPDGEARGIVEVGASLEPGKSYFFPRIEYAGTPLSMKSRHFREAIEELLEQNWLYPPEYDENTNTKTYEFRPKPA